MLELQEIMTKLRADNQGKVDIVNHCKRFGLLYHDFENCIKHDWLLLIIHRPKSLDFLFSTKLFKQTKDKGGETKEA